MLFLLQSSSSLHPYCHQPDRIANCCSVNERRDREELRDKCRCGPLTTYFGASAVGAGAAFHVCISRSFVLVLQAHQQLQGRGSIRPTIVSCQRRIYKPQHLPDIFDLLTNTTTLQASERAILGLRCVPIQGLYLGSLLPLPALSNLQPFSLPSFSLPAPQSIAVIPSCLAILSPSPPTSLVVVPSLQI